MEQDGCKSQFALIILNWNQSSNSLAVVLMLFFFFYYYFQVWHSYQCSDDAVQQRLQGPPRLTLPQRKHQPGQKVRFWHPTYRQGSVRPRSASALQLWRGGPDFPLWKQGSLLPFTLPKQGRRAGQGAGLWQLPAKPRPAGTSAEAQRGSAVHALLRGGDRCCILPLRPYGVLPDLRKSASGEDFSTVTCADKWLLKSDFCLKIKQFLLLRWVFSFTKSLLKLF